MPDKTKRYLFASLSFLLAVVFIFSFFGQAGSIGAFLKHFFNLLVGNVIFIIPLMAFVFGAVFLKEDDAFKEAKNSLIISTAILILGVSGIFALAELHGNAMLAQYFVWNYSGRGGWIGYMVSWPLLKWFDFWVTFFILDIAMAVSLLMIAEPFRKLIKEEDENKEENEIEDKIVKEEKKKVPMFNLEKIIPKKEEVPKPEEKKEDKDIKTFEQKKKESKEYKYPPLDLLSKKGGAARRRGHYLQFFGYQKNPADIRYTG